MQPVRLVLMRGLLLQAGLVWEKKYCSGRKITIVYDQANRLMHDARTTIITLFIHHLCTLARYMSLSIHIYYCSSIFILSEIQCCMHTSTILFLHMWPAEDSLTSSMGRSGTQCRSSCRQCRNTRTGCSTGCCCMSRHHPGCRTMAGREWPAQHKQGEVRPPQGP